MPWVGLAPYLLAARFRGGVSRRRLHAIALNGSGVSERTLHSAEAESYASDQCSGSGSASIR